MRKLLILMLVLGMTSMASAALTITVGGVDVGGEVTIAPSDSIWLGINDTAGGAKFSAAIMIADDPISQANGSWTGGNNYYTPPGVAGGFNSYFGYVTGIGDLWYLVDSDPGIPNPAAGLQSDYEFHCDGLGDVVVNLTAADLVTVLDTIVIHQIPEPMTLALLGLGGLLLRRRK